MEEIGYFEMDGVRFRSEPAREECFTVVRKDAEMHEYDGDGPEAIREVVHRHMSNEITSLDIAAQCLVEFPEAAWELKMELARQCWDESRHVVVLHRRLREIGGRKGEFPISAFEWCVTSSLDNLAARLATQNRTFEAGAMDVVASLIQKLRDLGDDGTAEVLESILADEVQHVRFANRWIKAMIREDPRTLMKVAGAIRYLASANAVLISREGDVNPVGKIAEDPDQRVPIVNIEDRQLAEFSDEEIHEVLRQAGFRSLIPAEASQS